MIGARVSVIVPMYNAEATIACALTSVLAQTRAAEEILVIDNGSDDRSVEIARAVGPSIRVLHESKRGPAAVRNRGIASAAGNVLAFLDSDDLMPLDRLAVQLACLQQYQHIDMVFGLQQRFEEGAEPRLANAARCNTPQAAIVPGAMMCRADAFRRAGHLRESLMFGEFIEWFSRARGLGMEYMVPDHVVLYRRAHAQNLTRDLNAAGAGYLQAIQQILARRRAGRPAA